MKRAVIAITVLIFIRTGYSQSNINPDISLIGTFNTKMNFIKGDPAYGKLNFEMPSMELFIDGYLNPYAKAAANLAYEEGEFSVEELYGNIVRGLPLDMQIKAGKYLVAFGKINTVHPHAWPFLNRPLFHQVFFSPEGFNDIGVNVSFLLPTGDVYSNLELGVYNGESIRVPEDTNAVERGINPIFAGRLSGFFNLNDFTNLEAGLSSSFGVSTKVNLPGETKPLNFFYGGLDLKYKYAPDSYTALTLQAEGLISNSDALQAGLSGIKTITTYGGFISADYKFAKQFSFGLKYDYTAGIFDGIPSLNTLIYDDNNNTQGVEGWISYLPVEETLVLRLGVQELFFTYADGTARNNETRATLQFLFSLGPHKAHQF